MISTIRGPVQATGHGFTVVEVGGFGIRVEVPTGTAARLHVGELLTLKTELIVREDSLTLYGFEFEEQLEVFNRLMTVSGVGPRSALGVLSALTTSEIVNAVLNEDSKPFQRVSGIGPKTAKLITISLAGKLDHLTSTVEGEPETVDAEATQVIAGLVGLGWQEGQAAQAVDDALAAGAHSESAALMRAALALLQGSRGRGATR